MPLVNMTGNLDRKKAAHLLRRTTFGPSRALIENFTNRSIGDAINLLFQNTPEPEPPIDPADGVTWIGTQFSGSGDGDRQEYIKHWWMALMSGFGAPAVLDQQAAFAFREKIVFFMHTYFTTIEDTVNSSRALYYQNVLFRRFALDGTLAPEFNFKSLSLKVILDNAMTKVLDNDQNVDGNPNENFSREYFELYTTGKGLEPRNQALELTDPLVAEGDYRYFTEEDIQAAARLLSGFDFDRTFSVIDLDTGLPRASIKGVEANGTGTPSSHDNDPKQFSARFNNTVITPDPALLDGNGDPTEASMLQELQDFVDMIFEQQTETAYHICRRVYRYFVYHDVTPELEDDIIADMVNIFQANNYKLEPVLRALLGSSHFFDSLDANAENDNFGGIIKSPLDLIIGAVRFFEYPLFDYVNDTENFYLFFKRIKETMDDMGMRMMNPFDIAGYDAYFQYPLFNRYWISTNALTLRYNFFQDAVDAGAMGTGDPEVVSLDVVAYVTNQIPANIASDAQELVRELVSILLPLADRDSLTFDETNDDNAEISAERMNYFLEFFLGDIDADPVGTWTVRWNNGNPLDPDVIRTQLENLFKALLQSPEYQLM